QEVDGIQTPKVVNFWKGGNLSPQKKPKGVVAETVVTPTTCEAEKTIIKKQGMSTPVKHSSTPDTIEKTNLISSNNMKADDIKRKLKGSSKLAELKTQIGDLETAKTAAEQKVTQLETDVQRLTAAETELKGFGETGEARTAFKQAADQNQIWVENMRKAGIVPSADATTMGQSELKSYEKAPWNEAAQAAKA
ncbi:MAG: hypothetical protein EAZ80_01670, partial [Runella slithyformis]